MRTIAAFVLLSGCFRGGAGTAVGNPGDADVKARALFPGVELDEVDVPVASLTLSACDGRLLTLPTRVTLDGLEPSEVLVPVPGGPACGLTLTLAGPMALAGTSGGTPFVAELPVGALSLDGSVFVDGQRLLFDVPLPLDGDAIAAAGYVLPATDPLAASWASGAAADTTLWEDLDLDGFVSADDGRVSVVHETGGPAAAYAESGGAGCGCTAGGLPLRGALAWGLAVIAVARRRRLTSPR